METLSNAENWDQMGSQQLIPAQSTMVAGEEFADDLTQCTTRFLIQQKNAYHKLHLHTIIEKRVVKMSVFFFGRLSNTWNFSYLYYCFGTQNTNLEHFIPHSYQILLLFFFLSFFSFYYYIIITRWLRADLLEHTCIFNVTFSENAIVF